MFFNGRGVEKNYKLALKWYRRSAKQGNARAQLNLGVMYNQGKGVPKDYKIAVMWYRKSAERGDAYAQYNLGIMYAYGWGVPRNYVLVHMWWTISSANRNKNAIRSRSGLGKKMTSKQIAEAKGLAREWMEKNRKK
jgi:TPR repeat protein